MRLGIAFEGESGADLAPVLEEPAVGLGDASMRKLLHPVFGVIKSGRPFDPDYLNTGLTGKTVSTTQEVRADNGAAVAPTLVGAASAAI